ncbi:AraC family transcriptional regulator [Treponema brennaborense]|uniref:Transcriptional regulator, AraC family n=1 Tax=Treponema brennaborense (strain DSM 12168 / CIP 105900 / DD5/3) TaxID=906968 RepID=F4LNP2_TREBD|nr:AraC family transcriptional regulator [Treponema brennaborense]AEE16877.1 transcriptional regulator, AraC family [Treponema brennaborense DSM 12168]
MKSFQDFLEETGWKSCPNCSKYCQVGKTVCIRSEDFDGLYWYYETDQFIIDIHDFFIKKEKMINSFPDMSRFLLFSTSYIKSANGESFNPYQTLTANTVFVTNAGKTKCRLLLHANFPYLSVGVNFKENMIKEYISCHLGTPPATVSDVFFDTRELVTKPMEKLANAVLNCNMSAPAARIFFEAKAKEWLSITLNAYLNKAKTKKIFESDERNIENVANYINDHYALDISQEILEKIALMSGTKLKNVFKQKYQMSITEYSQRKRMNIAETLLATTELEIRDVAKSVGYTSHSRFTTLFKKYKGIYPREVKKRGPQNDGNNVCVCMCAG